MSNFQFPISKVLLAVIVVFGVFVAGSVLAANASDLQPADNPGSKTFSEPVVINSTLNVNKAGYFPAGVHIGKTTGEGGVTYFNGTIVNASEGDVPVTFGDDVRIDGVIYRTEPGGEHPLKVSDTVIPTADNMNDLGSSSYQWKDGYFAGNVNAKAVYVGGKPVSSAAAADLLGREEGGTEGLYFVSNDPNETMLTFQVNDKKTLVFKADGTIGSINDQDTDYVHFDAPLRLLNLHEKSVPPCDSDHEGTIRFGTDEHGDSKFFGCDGSSWKAL